MQRRLMKIARMASSSKRRTSSNKKSGAGNARVIPVKRADTLPRTGVASADRHESIAEPSLDAPAEPLAKTIAGSKRRVQRKKETETVGSRTKAPRAAGGASGKAKKPAAKVRRLAPAVAPETVDVATPAVVVETRPAGEVEALTVIDVSATTLAAGPAVEPLAGVETEIMVEPSAILEETTIAMPIAPVLRPGKRGVVRTVTRLLSILRRWTGARL